jgi:diadenosine tetraphosphate (Ap4A) HIT family hydrolase
MKVEFITNPETQNIIAENEKAIALHFPKAVRAGHFIVACKTPVRKIEDVPADELIAASLMLQEVCKKVGNLLKCERFYIAVVGDFDHHFHYHAVPKYENEPNMGKFLFSPEGWAGLLDKGDIEQTKISINASFK